MNEQWEKEIRRKMLSYEGQAPEVSWQELDKALANRRKAAIVPLWGRRIAAAAIVALVAGAGWIYISDIHDMKQDDNLAMNTQASTEKEALTKSKERHEETATDSPVKNVATLAYVPKVKVSSLSEPSATTDQATAPTTYPEQAKSTTQEPAKGKEENHEQLKKKQSLNDLFAEELPTTKPKHRHKLTAKAYLGNSTTDYANRGERTTLMMSSMALYQSESTNMLVNKVNKVMSGTTPEETNVDHRQPIRYGISLRYELSDRWSVEAGLTYSYLRSELTVMGSSYERETTQRLHYVGIPITASYSVWRTNKLNFYASAGATVEKMVSGRAENNTYIYGNGMEQTTEKLTINPLQLSVGCAVGAEYLFTTNFGAYAEPGLSYYFDNHSNIPTIYSDKPLNFNLNVGLRLSFK